MSFTTVVLCLAASVLTGVHGFGPKAGPYEIDIQKLEPCEDQGSGKFVFATRITNAGKRKYYYNENFTLGAPFDENIKAHVEVQRWGNGGWKPKYAQHTAKNCEEIFKYVGDFLKSLMASAGLTVDKCPVPAGNYTANNWMIEFSMEKNFPVMEYGKYRGILTFFYKKEKAGCYKIYADIVPKGV